MMEQQADSEVVTERRGRLGILTLNRPKALNALSHTMVELLDATLGEWAEDPAIDAVLLRGAGRAFCAGGDVRAIGGLADPAARADLARRFFGTEYRLNLRTASSSAVAWASPYTVRFASSMRRRSWRCPRRHWVCFPMSVRRGFSAAAPDGSVFISG
jgi:1,4-dihydroxy-2-naphthoyl-CoA synthase